MKIDVESAELEVLKGAERLKKFAGVIFINSYLSYCNRSPRNRGLPQNTRFICAKLLYIWKNFYMGLGEVILSITTYVREQLLNSSVISIISFLRRCRLIPNIVNLYFEGYRMVFIIRAIKRGRSKAPPVSIIIPTIGTRPILYRLLERVINYDYDGEIEILVVPRPFI